MVSRCSLREELLKVGSQAGLLTQGSIVAPRLPHLAGEWHVRSTSPITVAGP
jgi:hypothetical protein